MPLISKVATSQELVVNFYCCETSRQARVNVWKVQSAPSIDIQVGQTIWFYSNVFVMGGDMGAHLEPMRKRREAGGFKYEGEVLRIVAWQRHWIRFSMGSQGVEEFQLWVPVHWTAMGFILRALHLLQKGSLPDSIPSLPEATGFVTNVGV
jgi:hypothetical protein